jgi:hypothetical protein
MKKEKMIEKNSEMVFDLAGDAVYYDYFPKMRFH